MIYPHYVDIMNWCLRTIVAVVVVVVAVVVVVVVDNNNHFSRA